MVATLTHTMEGTLGRRAMARTLAYFYFAGATLALASLALPHAEKTRVPALLCAVAVAYAIGTVLAAAADRLPGAALPSFLAFGTVLITAAVWLDGHADSAYAFFYVWVAVVAFYFLRIRLAAVQLLLVGGSYAWALVVVDGASVPLQRWLITVGTAAVAGGIVAYMRRRIEHLVAWLSDAARTDRLTGLLNRRGFEELFEIELERARREGRPLSLLVGDLDGFKRVNDRLGHHAGDTALELLGQELARWKRRSDVVARIGGEEFALLLPDTDGPDALVVAERFRHAVATILRDQPLPVTISVGAASFPEHGDDAERLMRAADEALYAAKDLGKDRAVLHSPEFAARLGNGSEPGEPSGLQLATVLGLAEALDIRQTGAARHSHTVARYARMIGEELGLDPARVERLRLAGLLHDVGKIAVSDGVLMKAGPLTGDEWSEVHTHPEIAARLLAQPEVADLRSWILAHHERPDGSGYPHGLLGSDIPLEARVLAVADAYEAMTSGRAHRRALGPEDARAELVEGRGTQFDARVVHAFLRVLDRRLQADLVATAPSVTN
jgi:diguanylate cyclase (GGDEF)-like protein